MYHFVSLSSITTVCLELEVKHKYLQSRASRCLSLSSSSGDVSSTRAYILDFASRNLIERNWNNSTLQMFFWYHMTKPRFGQKQKNNYHFQLVVFQGNFFDLKQIPIHVKLLRSKMELNQFTVGFFVLDMLYVLIKFFFYHSIKLICTVVYEAGNKFFWNLR